MSTTILRAPDGTVSQRPDGPTITQQHGSGNRAVRWLVTPRVWIERSRQRRALRELGERNDARLQDIGISPQDARRESAKPFWQP